MEEVSERGPLEETARKPSPGQPYPPIVGVLCDRGTEVLSASYVFAAFLFAPFNSLAVKDESARTNLILMSLFGLVISYFYGREDSSKDANPPPTGRVIGTTRHSEILFTFVSAKRLMSSSRVQVPARETISGCLLNFIRRVQGVGMSCCTVP